jgi:cation-transporting ATPase E
MPGLTSEQVRERIRHGKVNTPVETSTHSVKKIILENVLTYFNFIFVILAIMLIMVGSFKDLSFMLIVIANTVIGILQEIRSKNILDNLRFDKMPKVTAVRDGQNVELRSEDLVLDDVIMLSSGMQIPADARVLEGTISVNESLLTGESDEIEKKHGDSLMSGSFVVSGEALVQLVAVGEDSYLSKLTLEATRQKKNDSRSEMVKSLDRLVLVIGILIIPVGGILFYQQYVVQDQGFNSSVISMVAAVLGMVPEGLYMMASVALVVSALRLAQKEVLVQNMRCIETLARVDVLCVDKTGTITENKMNVSDFQILRSDVTEEEGEALMGDFAVAMNPDNITMAAVKERFKVNSGREPEHVCGFSSKYKYSGVTYKEGSMVLGAPEFVLTKERYDKIADRVEAGGKTGARVLVFGVTPEVPKGQTLQKVHPIALVMLQNPVRQGAPETFRYFEDHGVSVKVISGDNPVTVSEVAKEAKIAGAEHYVDARDLRDERDVADIVEDTVVFGRVTPDQKRQIVHQLQKKGHKVAMTGDGVNDILALRDADTSIAMASGSEAASHAAQLVLMDSDFSRMPEVVAEGRRVVNNVIKTASLYLTKNIFSFLLAIFSVISVVQYPLQPSQITLISMFTIGIPSFVLSLEPNNKEIRGSFLGNTFKMATPAGITIFISVSGLLVFGQVMEISQASISTASAGLVALGEFLILARVARPMNTLHAGMIGIMVIGFFSMILLHHELFGISPMNLKCAALMIVFLLATECMFRYFYKLTTLLGLLLTKEGRARAKRGMSRKIENYNRLKEQHRANGGSWKDFFK